MSDDRYNELKDQARRLYDKLDRELAAMKDRIDKRINSIDLMLRGLVVVGIVAAIAIVVAIAVKP